MTDDRERAEELVEEVNAALRQLGGMPNAWANRNRATGDWNIHLGVDQLTATMLVNGLNLLLDRAKSADERSS